MVRVLTLGRDTTFEREEFIEELRAGPLLPNDPPRPKELVEELGRDGALYEDLPPPKELPPDRLPPPNDPGPAITLAAMTKAASAANSLFFIVFNYHRQLD